MFLSGQENSSIVTFCENKEQAHSYAGSETKINKKDF